MADMDHDAIKDNTVTNFDIINAIRQLKTDSNKANKKLESQIKGMEAAKEKNNDIIRGEFKESGAINRARAERIETRMTGLEKEFFKYKHMHYRTSPKNNEEIDNAIGKETVTNDMEIENNDADGRDTSVGSSTSSNYRSRWAN